MMTPTAQDILKESQLFSFSSFYWDEIEFNQWQAAGYLLFKLNLQLTEESHHFSDLLENYVDDIHRIEKNHFVNCSMKKAKNNNSNKIVVQAGESGYLTGELVDALIANIDDLNRARTDAMNKVLNCDDLLLLEGLKESKVFQNTTNELDSKSSIIGLSNPVITRDELNKLISTMLANKDL